jgi:hypothetical protein
MEHVARVQDLHEVDGAHAPRPFLLADDGVEGGRRGPMAAARIEINEIDGFHDCQLAQEYGNGETAM